MARTHHSDFTEYFIDYLVHRYMEVALLLKVFSKIAQAVVQVTK